MTKMEIRKNSFYAQMKELHPNLKIISDYQGAAKKIIIEDELGIKYLTFPLNILKAKQPSIQTALDKTEAFRLKMKVINPEIEILDDYVDTNTKISVRFKGNIYLTSVNTLINNKNLSSLNIKNKNQYFINRAIKIYGNKYNYSKVNYIAENRKVIVICKEHGDFLITPSDHLHGLKCPKCSSRRLHYTTDIFIQEARKIHGNKFDYKDCIFTGMDKNVKLICNTCKKTVFPKASDHLNNTNCKHCSGTGWTKQSWKTSYLKSKKKHIPTLYIIRCYNDNEEFVKIGITFKKLAYRFYGNTLPYSYEVLKETKGSPDFIWDKEKELHKLCKEYKYRPLDVFAGSSECFTLDCLTILKENLVL